MRVPGVLRLWFDQVATRYSRVKSSSSATVDCGLAPADKINSGVQGSRRRLGVVQLNGQLLLVLAGGAFLLTGHVVLLAEALLIPGKGSGVALCSPFKALLTYVPGATPYTVLHCILYASKPVLHTMCVLALQEVDHWEEVSAALQGMG
jgi:hypothetical protein